MKSLHLSHADYEELLRTLLATQHAFAALDQTKVTQEGVTYTFDAIPHKKALERALNIVGWKAGDPTPPGLPFERE